MLMFSLHSSKFLLRACIYNGCWKLFRTARDAGVSVRYHGQLVLRYSIRITPRLYAHPILMYNFNHSSIHRRLRHLSHNPRGLAKENALQDRLALLSSPHARTSQFLFPPRLLGLC